MTSYPPPPKGYGVAGEVRISGTWGFASALATPSQESPALRKKMNGLRPGVCQISTHARGVCVHFGGVICECLEGVFIQGERFRMLQEKGIDAEGVCYGIKSRFCVPLARSAPPAASGIHMPADILYKRGAAFEVPGQSLGCCEGASHAPGF